MFSLTFHGVNGHLWVEHLLTGLPGGQLGFLIVVNMLVFFLAFFLDFFELAFIVVPLLAPVADKLGIDLIWFGVLLGVNMQTSFMHPPFGFALFYLRSVAPAERLYRPGHRQAHCAGHHGADLLGRVPFVLIQVIMVGADHRLPADRRWCTSRTRRKIDIDKVTDRDAGRSAGDSADADATSLDGAAAAASAAAPTAGAEAGADEGAASRSAQKAKSAGSGADAGEAAPRKRPRDAGPFPLRRSLRCF